MFVLCSAWSPWWLWSMEQHRWVQSGVRTEYFVQTCPRAPRAGARQQHCGQTRADFPGEPAGESGSRRGACPEVAAQQETARWAFKELRSILASPPAPPPSFFCQVANPDGDFRLTIVNASVLDRPRALVLLPQDG